MFFPWTLSVATYSTRTQDWYFCPAQINRCLERRIINFINTYYKIMGNVLTVMYFPWRKICLSTEISKNLMPNVECKGIPKAGVCQWFLCMVFYFEELVVVLPFFLSSDFWTPYQFPETQQHVLCAYITFSWRFFTARCRWICFKKKVSRRNVSQWLLLCWKWIFQSVIL